MAKPKPYPDLTSEVALGFSASGGAKARLIVGVDEVGRGCLAGPVVAAAAILHLDVWTHLPFNEAGARAGKRESKKRLTSPELRALWEVCDSKLVAEEDRASMAAVVKSFVRGYAIAEASVEEINRLNILYASHLAMERAVAELERQIGMEADVVIVDGHIVPKGFQLRGSGRAVPIIKGDQKSFTIACASIIAKTYRDDLMGRLDMEYPGYGHKQHKGYPTPFHKEQIRILGITPLHRAGFRGVIEFIGTDDKDQKILGDDLGSDNPVF